MCLLGLGAAQGALNVAVAVAAPQLESLLALPKSKHFASCQFSIACKRTEGKQCVQRQQEQQQQQRWEMGKMEKTFPRKTLALPFAFALVFVFASISISLGACFHFGFTFDLTVVRASVATVRLAWLRFVSQFVYLAPSPALRFNARQGKRHTNIYARREDNANARQKFDSPFTNE